MIGTAFETGGRTLEARASIEVFSGRPAPAWTLTDDEAEQLVSMLSRLPPAEAPARPGLGYRGVAVQLSDHPEISPVRVWGGTVVLGPVEGSVLRDDDRRVERWLWESAQRRLPPEVLRVIESHAPKES